MRRFSLSSSITHSRGGVDVYAVGLTRETDCAVLLFERRATHFVPVIATCQTGNAHRADVADPEIGMQGFADRAKSDSRYFRWSVPCAMPRRQSRSDRVRRIRPLRPCVFAFHQAQRPSGLRRPAHCRIRHARARCARSRGRKARFGGMRAEPRPAYRHAAAYRLPAASLASRDSQNHRYGTAFGLRVIRCAPCKHSEAVACALPISANDQPAVMFAEAERPSMLNCVFNCCAVAIYLNSYINLSDFVRGA